MRVILQQQKNLPILIMKKKFTRAAFLLCSLILLLTVQSNAQSKLISFWDFNMTRPLGGGSTDSLGTRFSYANPFVIFHGSTDSLNKTYPLFANYTTMPVNNSRIVADCYPATVPEPVQNKNGGSFIYDYSSNHNYFGNIHPYYATSDTSGAAKNCYIKIINPVQSDTIFMYLPTTGYENIRLDFAMENSSTTSAPNYQIFSYSTNSGATWKNLTRAMDTFNVSSTPTPDTLVANTAIMANFQPKSINFTSDASVNNNANVMLRWVYLGPNVTLAAGNARYDNFALVGDSVCPTAFSLQPANFVICGGGGNADFVVHVVGGTAVTYQWEVNPGSGFVNVVNGGIYSGATTDSLIITGANSVENGYLYECVINNVGCGSITSTSATLTVDPVLTSSISGHTDVTCAGNGSATVLASGGTLPYTYLWNDPLHQNTVTATNLSAGTYTITTTDNVGCSTTAGVTIAQHGLVITLSGIVNIECTAFGSATATASNGTAPYTYSWAPGGASTGTVTNLSAGTYTITAKDNTGCTNTAPVTISNVLPVRDSINGYGIPQTIHYWDFNNTPPVGGGGGDSLGNPTNPLYAPYTALASWNPRIVYSYPSAIQTVPYVATLPDGILDNLTPGAAVNDLHILGNDTGGSAANNLAVRARNPSENAYMYLYLPTNGYQNIQLNYALSASSTKGANYNVFSYSTNGGAIWKNLTTAMDTFNISGVRRPDTLQAINPTTAASLWYPVNINFTSDPSVNNNPNFVVRWQFEGPNSTGTSGNDRYDNFSLSGNIRTETCNGSANYTAVAGVKYGQTPYTYVWTPSVSSNATASNISAGTYTVAVTDALGCSMSSTITVSQPTVVTATISATHSVTCSGSSNGGTTANGGGGTFPYYYSWSSGQTTGTITGVSAGSYTVKVTDTYGCTATAATTITQPAPLSVTHDSLSDGGSCDGLAAVTPSGGTPPYTYLWTPDGQSTDTIKHQCARTYCCNVTDKNGCTYYTCVTVLSNLGINNISNPANINIYPDPNTGNFTVAGVSQGQVIELYDYTGKKISSIAADNNSAMHFDISNKANGIYLVRIINRDGSIASENKIVKTQ